MGNCFIISIVFMIDYHWLKHRFLIQFMGANLYTTHWFLKSYSGALRSAFSPLSVERFEIGCCQCVVDLDSLLQNFKIKLTVFYLGCLKQPTFVPGCENVQYILFQLFHRDQPFNIQYESKAIMSQSVGEIKDRVVWGFMAHLEHRGCSRLKELIWLFNRVYLFFFFCLHSIKWSCGG